MDKWVDNKLYQGWNQRPDPLTENLLEYMREKMSGQVTKEERKVEYRGQGDRKWSDSDKTKRQGREKTDDETRI